MIGTTIASRFKILSELGQGGFSKTFIAEDCHLPDRPKCVIKQLQPPDTRSLVMEISQRMFEREAQVLYKLGKHPQIPLLLAHFENDNKFYLAIEFIDGQILSKEIFDGCRHTETYVLELLHQVLEILSFVHAQNVIHRDIKPSNIIRRSSDNKLVLIDFGAVKEVAIQNFNNHEPTKQTVAIGSYGYMANEQANGRPKFASDLYSLGMVCIYALTGVPPQRLTEDTKTGEIVWHDLAPEISPELRAYLDRLVRSHFAQRFENAQEALIVFKQLFDPETSYTISAENRTVLHHIPELEKSTEPTIYYGTPQTEVKIDSAIPTNIINGNNQLSPANPTSAQIEASLQPKTLVASAYTEYSTPSSQPKMNFLIPIAVITLLGTGVAGYWLWQNYETDKRYAQEVANINELFKDKQYQECIDRSRSIPDSSPHFPSARVLAENCQKELNNQIAEQALASGKKLVAEKKYAQAIAQLQKISTDTSSYPEALLLIEISGKELIITATKLYEQQGKKDEAIVQIKIIPTTVASGKNAQTLIAKWEKEWSKNLKTKQDIDKADQEGKWQQVIDLAQKLTTPYWKNHRDVRAAIDRARTALAPPPEPISNPQPDVYVPPPAPPPIPEPEPDQSGGIGF
ncbi:MAG: protein kinase domain-containing protein [Pseudanabaenaceae cyanobacterium]